MNIINWIKSNKISSLLILILAYLIIIKPFISNNLHSYKYSTYNDSMALGSPSALPNIGAVVSPTKRESVNTQATNRMVIEETSLSAQVKDVPNSQNAIKAKAEELGGFMVSETLSRPEEAASGTVIVRVPVENLRTMLDFIRSNSVKVVSENILGYDVTDQYSDINAKVQTLQNTKNIFENVLNKATTVEEILKVQTEILNIQDQMDSLKGQAQYLEKTSSSVKITVYLSTDEYSLPYAPQTGFRPNVIFKEAVRSLVLDARKLASLAIWVGVYAVIWAPILTILIILKRKNLPPFNRPKSK